MDNVPLVEFDLPQVEPWVFSIFGNTCMRRAFLQYEEGGSTAQSVRYQRFFVPCRALANSSFEIAPITATYTDTTIQAVASRSQQTPTERLDNSQWKLLDRFP